MRKFILCGFTIISCLFLGCASYSNLFVGPNGDMKRCSSSGRGIIGIILAQEVENDCEKDFLSAGYLPIDKAGAIGIIITASDTIVTILKVYAYTPASQDSLLSGDHILEIDNARVKTPAEANILLFGPVDKPVTLIIERNGRISRHEITRATYKGIFGNQFSY